jgi:outer membrane lipoprotein carrier protein
MRWEYTEPAGKLLVGDGELIHMYSPLTNQVTRFPLKETPDLRAPLAFLLGRLNFERLFRQLRLETIDGSPAVVGEGRPGDSYHRVEFSYDPKTYALRGLKVFGRDESLTTFRFANERTNPRLDPSRFEFRPPPGAEIVDPEPYTESR